MKRIVKIVCIVFLISFSIVSCDDNNRSNDLYDIIDKLPYSKSETYMAMFVDNQTTWQSNEFETCYVKIPTIENPTWFDIVFAYNEEQTNYIDKIDNKYLFIHTDNILTKFFSFDSVVCFENNLKIIYYEDKRIEENHAIYSKYLTNPKGKLTITYNDGNYMSGNFIGTLYDIYKKQTHNVVLYFNHIPISIAK